MAVTDLAFHSGVADKLGYTCRLLRKAWRAGNRVWVAGSVDQLARLDAMLWAFEPGEFIPHLRIRAGQAVAPLLAATPIWLGDTPADLHPMPPHAMCWSTSVRALRQGLTNLRG